MEETLEKCIPPKSILLQILQGLAPNQANVTGLEWINYFKYMIQYNGMLMDRNQDQKVWSSIPIAGPV